MVLPAVGLSLFYFSDLLSSIKLLTERDVRFGRTAADLTFIMLNIQRQERTYRIFGSPADHDLIIRLISRADSILESIRTIVPETERETFTELAGKLDSYSGSFEMLAAYMEENPPDARLQKFSLKTETDTGEFETMYHKYRSQLQTVSPGLRDSLLVEAVKYIDIFSIDRITGFPGSSGKAGRTSLLQQSLDTSRQEFISAANRFAAENWRLMEEHKEESLRIEARAKRNIIFVLILAAVIGGFMIVLLPRRIVKPISTLSTLIRMTGNGEKDVEPPVFPGDEIGELASAYSAVMERMRHLDDLKTKRIASQKRFIERLLDYLYVPVCILTKNFTALYMNSLFTRIFGASVQQKIPEGGFDITSIPEMHPFIEEIRKKIAQAPGDFTFKATAPGGVETAFRGRPVRNAALNLETILVVGAPMNPEKG